MKNLSLTSLAILLAAVPLHAGVESRVLWLDGQPQVEVSIDAEPPQPVKEIEVPIELTDAQGQRVWNTVVKVPTTGERPWKARVPLDKIKDPRKQHKLSLRLPAEWLGDYAEEIYFAAETALVQTYGLRAQGLFPARKALLTLGLNGFKSPETRDIPVTVRIRDGDDNTVATRQAVLKPAREPGPHLIDVTPDAGPAGPFSLDVNAESEVHQLFFNAGLKFALANARLPLSSMEHGDPAVWFNGSPTNRPTYQTHQFYYSPHLTDLKHYDTPAVRYDREQKHTGRQSLRIDYPVDRESDVWGLQVLPGKPVGLGLWVHGNGSNDQLVIYFEDNSSFTAPAWQRFADFSSAVVCTLSFNGWRRFRVPVLGDGLQVSSTKGSTEKVDAPVRILALSLKPGPLPKGAKPDPKTLRSVWIDDLEVETQVGAAEALSMELQLDDVQGRLAADAKVAVTVGNGFMTPLKRGKVALTARSGEAPLWTASVDLPVEASGFASVEVPLKNLADKAPRGPIDLDVTFQDAAQAGARISRRLTLKAAVHAGIVHDFEEPISFNGYQPGKAGKSEAKVVDGGAEGSAHSLALPVKPGQADNSVLFHPALPGILDRVEIMVHGSGKRVTLQPWFIDSGYTGIWLRPYNLFWAEPVIVDWQGWRKVVIAAPPIPAYHGDKNRYFLFRPWYPLNFALNATVDGEDATEIRLDNLRAVTHLPEDELLKPEVEYPDETRIHPPGSALRLFLTNFAPTSTPLHLHYELRNYQGLVARSGQLDVVVPAGNKYKATLVDALPPGIYDLTVQGAGKSALTAPILVLDAKKYFGDEPGEVLGNPLLLRWQLGLTLERTYLDWDNVEPAPFLHHNQWFEEELKKLREIKILPKDLQPLAAKYEAASLAVKEAEKLRQTSQTLSVQAAQGVRPFAERVESTVRMQTAAGVEVEGAEKRAAELQSRVASLVKEADVFKTAAAQAMKSAQAAAEELKKSQQAQLAADKAQTQALATAKEATSKSSAAQAAQAAAEREAVAADKAAKSAADAKSDKAKELRARADDLKKKAENAAKAVKAALELAQAKMADADKARAAASVARAATEKATAQAAKAKQVSAEAAQKSMAALRAAEGPKRDLAAAMQRLQAAKQKMMNIAQALENNRKALQEKVEAAQKAQADLEAAVAKLASAKTEFETIDKAYEKAKSRYYFTVQPVVGFCTDWAGPEAVETLRKATYTRWIPNRLQLPRRLVDWSQFVREVQREYKGRFDTWVFWENPDLDDSPQSIPPKMYRPLLDTFARWVRLYSPNSRVVAGGFNFPKALTYLHRVPDAAGLPFDELAVQMNLGELSPEHADVEGFLDDLNALLHINETKRTVRLTELDWGIGKFLSPMQQAAYHARAALILASRGVPPHQFNVINTGFEFEGYGVCYRVAYGNTADLQTFKPYHVPKPSYFALIESQKFLKEWQYIAGVNPSDRNLADNRAFVYRNAGGALTAAIWRATDGERVYRVPAAWQGADARDIFGFPAPLDRGLRCTPLPTLVRLPAGYNADQLLHDLRMLEAVDNSDPVVLDLHIAEADSARRAGYQSTGKLQVVQRSGALLGERKVSEPYVEGLETEQFSFDLPQAGNILLRRRWYFNGEGQKLHVKVNDGPDEPWDQGKGQGNDPGLRETTFVLRGCRTGKNRVSIRYEKPGNCAGYRLEPMPADHLPLVRAGMLNSRQSRGEALKHASAVGTPLTFGKTPCADGIGAHAVSFIEYPLAGQFTAFEVTVGIDGSTEGRGSVVFRIYVDGKERASSGPINGFSKPKTLKVDGLVGAQRLILNVTDAEDGNRDDLANWVDGKLFLR